MNENPKVTIITVTYNCSSTIQRTIDSVINQAYENLEYIIVDGGSSDGTLEIISKNQKAYPEVITYITGKDKGLYDAMNKGIKKASGDIVGIINGDDYYTNGAIKEAVRLLSNPENEIVYSDLLYIKNDVIDTKHPLYADHTKLVERMSVNHPTCFVKKSLYDKYGGFDIHFQIAADYEIMVRFYKKGCKFVKSDKILAVMKAGGISKNNWKSVHEKYEIHRRYFDRMSAEIFRIRNILLYVYRFLKNK